MWRKRREQQIARVFDGEAADSKTAGPPGKPDDSLTLIREGARAARRRAFPRSLNAASASGVALRAAGPRLAAWIPP